MRQLLLGSSIGLAILMSLSARAQAQHRGFGGGMGHGFGGGHPMPPHVMPNHPPSHHPVPPIRPIQTTAPRPVSHPHPQPPHIVPNSSRPRPVATGNGVKPTTRPRPVVVGKGVKPTTRPRPVVVGKGIKPTTRPRPVVVGKGVKPTTRPRPGSGSTVVTKPRPLGGSVGKGHTIVSTTVKGHGKVGTQVALSKLNQALILKAIARIGDRITNALLLSALQNAACGQPLSGAQIACLGQYLNDPGCLLSAGEQGCLQQCLGGGEEVVDANGDNGDGTSVAGTDDNGDSTNTDTNGDNGGDDNGSSDSDDGGVVVQSVKDGGAAAEAGLQAGDVILSFGDVRTHTFEELQDAVGQANGPVKVVFINSENGQTEYVMVEPQAGRIGVTCE